MTLRAFRQSLDSSLASFEAESYWQLRGTCRPEIVSAFSRRAGTGDIQGGVTQKTPTCISLRRKSENISSMVNMSKRNAHRAP